MSGRRRNGGRSSASAFAALGDETRLDLLARLAAGKRCSISELTAGSKMTRQAVTKHLRVLERVRIVHGKRVGRENLFELNPQPLRKMESYLETISRQWDSALVRLKAFVEADPPR